MRHSFNATDIWITDDSFFFNRKRLESKFLIYWALNAAFILINQANECSFNQHALGLLWKVFILFQNCPEISAWTFLKHFNAFICFNRHLVKAKATAFGVVIYRLRVWGFRNFVASRFVQVYQVMRPVEYDLFVEFSKRASYLWKMKHYYHMQMPKSYFISSYASTKCLDKQYHPSRTNCKTSSSRVPANFWLVSLNHIPKNWMKETNINLGAAPNSSVL